MKIKIHGERIEVDGTDMGAVRRFVNDHKLKGAILIYQDDEGMNVVHWGRKGNRMSELWRALLRMADDS